MLPSPHPLSNKRRVVLVEDDEELAMLLRYNLEAAGFAVETSTDGIAALRLLVERPPELVVLDWGIPGLSGIEILRRLKLGEHASVPILMLTARTDIQDKRRAISLGADAFIGKPFTLRELMAAVERLMQQDAEQSIAALSA